MIQQGPFGGRLLRAHVTQSADQVAAFKSWIERGAHYAEEPLRPRRAGLDWWSLRKIESPAVPNAGFGWARTPIDAFVLAALRELVLDRKRRVDCASDCLP